MLTVSIFVINIVLHRPFIDALLFSLAIAIGHHAAAAPGDRDREPVHGLGALAAKKVLVKRLVEHRGPRQHRTLFTDKTGTLTEGASPSSARSTPAGAHRRPLLLGLVCNEADLPSKAVSGNALDQALWRRRGRRGSGPRRAARQMRRRVRPFDHERRLASVVVDGPRRRTVRGHQGRAGGVLARGTKVAVPGRRSDALRSPTGPA